MRYPSILFVLLASTACSQSTGGGNANGSTDSTSGNTTSTGGGSVATNTSTVGGSSSVASGATTSSAATQTTAVGPTNDGPSNVTGTASDSSTGGATGNSGQTTSANDGSSTLSDATSTTAPSSTSTDESEATSSAGEQTSNVLPVNNCVGQKVPSANPTAAGPFQVAADKEVGPLAGVVPDPIYGDNQQRFNVYRPANLESSEYCHPILIWANGFRDNPEQKPPDCIVNQGQDRWCGQYLPMLNHLASHGFVVVASLSTATADEPLPTIAGLDWILEQAADPESPYYGKLDTSNIGQLGHSYGGMSTCKSASEPRYKALATICGAGPLSGVHTPMLFFCGGQDTVATCSGIKERYQSVTDQPAFYLNERDADHGSWVYEGADGVSLSAAAAWFRAHLLEDEQSRGYFYGPNCKFCTDNRVEAEQNSLMAQ